MHINAIDEIERVLGEIDSKIKHLESSPNRAFVLVEYDTLNLFHWFNLCFKQFWDEFNRYSANQLLLLLKYVNKYSELCDRYVSLFREQLDYLKEVIDFKNERVNELPPVLLSEDNETDVIGYYKDYFKDYTDEDGKPLYEIDLERGTCSEVINGETVPIDFYMLRSDKLNNSHYKALLSMYNCLKSIFDLMCVVCSFPEELLSGYKPSQEDITKALENELRQYAKEVGKKVERDLKTIAQELKPSRNSQLTSDTWGRVMEEEDDLYRMAISGQLVENKEKRFEIIFEEQRKKLTDNSAVLQKIKNTAIDGELFDIRLSVETHNLLSSLNADNLDLFYELILRRNIIQRKMFPDELGVVYEEWLNPSEEQHQEEGEEIKEELNYNGPKISMQRLLQQTWFAAVRTDAKYDAQWTDSFIEALMQSKYGEGIARDWAVKGVRNKRTLLKAYVVGLLKDAGVLNGSYDSIAKEINITDDPRTFSKYMGEGKEQPYAEWVKEYVSESIEQ